jgi:hypothetical protein
MANSLSASWLDLSEETEAALIAGARDTHPVTGLTHNFYRYPARFSPAFVRAAIQAFSSPGDTVMDPYVGGGTTAVEAIALGRNAVGVDVSELAEFVSEVKTTVMTTTELEVLAGWAERVGRAINVRLLSIHFPDYEERGYFKHLDGPSRWRLRRAIEQAIGSALALNSSKLIAFARCAVLRTAQWALDGRRTLPSVPQFRTMLEETAMDMVKGARELAGAVGACGVVPTVSILNRSAAGLEDDERLLEMPVPKLVVTSPPYPGIHVLYHRWQVDGRKETAAPFWIANKLDGSGSSYYTMGDRKNAQHRTYFESLLAATTSVVGLCDSSTTFVQMVAFSNPALQLPRYLESMKTAGLSEVFLPSLAGNGDGRLWRTVPNRKWYAHQRGNTPGSQEVVLLHRKAHQHGASTHAQPVRRLSETSSAT